MVRRIRKKLDEFVEKDAKIKVLSASGVKIWHLGEHLKKYKAVFRDEEKDGVVIHGRTHLVERGTGRIYELWEGQKKKY